ncbi:CPBP family intramembrane glutamic endopeptidase [Brevibacillus laterosporus]|uniref:CPBP family intramembrane glutamic endopeptidase n=1 Tax=Brevibacillus laterosporus TaxID=1465 RepID=UPI0003B21001|nr:CPBP family intramembrane glutamic endopeptidase [Brevibacillus laterosporus]ERM18229.1 hypothetical protein P615_17940 [Brevibacillus laterosporus PE36]
MNKFFKWEPKESDIPFYNGTPVELTQKNWLLTFGALICSFLFSPIITLFVENEQLAEWLAVILFPLVLFYGWRIAAGRQAYALFRKITLRDLGMVLVFLPVSLIGTLLLGFVVELFFPLSAHPGITASADEARTAASSVVSELLINNGVHNLFQLFWEELIVILPFIAVMQFFYQKAKFSRKKAMLVALLLSSILFGLFHLSTYEGNLVQAIVVIGLGRMFDTLAYIVTRNLWVSFIVHFLYDMILFLMAFLFG